MIKDVLELTRTYSEKHGKALLTFLRKEVPPSSDLTYDHVATGAVIYLGLGAAMQALFLGSINVTKVQWIDIVIVQLIFWVMITILVSVVLRIGGTVSLEQILLIVFRVFPIAFFCGAFSSALGYAVQKCINVTLSPTDKINNLPLHFHTLVALAILIVYLPREVRIHASRGNASAILVTSLVVMVVFAVSYVRVLLPYFEPAQLK